MGEIYPGRGARALPFPALPLAGRERSGPRPPVDPLFLAVETEDFPAQALAAWDPALRGGLFVVVDQDPDSHKTCALACSREARALGLHAGMPLAFIRRRFRKVAPVFRKAAWEAALREELEAVCLRHTPDFEVREDGRALLDLAGTPGLRALGAQGLARRLRRDILFHTGLTDVALGLAATRLMARVMARQAHPDTLRICPAGREAETLAPLGPDLLPGLSPVCRERLRRYALPSIGAVRSLGRQALAARFGREGDKLYTLACGLDFQDHGRGPQPGAAARRRGISAETVLPEDINDDDVLARKVRLTADKLAFRLRREGAVAGRITVAIRYSDHKAARKTLPVLPPTDAYLPLADLALRGFLAAYRRRVSLRSISLTVARPGKDTGQVDLFEGAGDRRQRAIGEALAKIRLRGGFAAIGSAGG